MSAAAADVERVGALLSAVVLLRPDRDSVAGRRLRTAAALVVMQRVDVLPLLGRGCDG